MNGGPEVKSAREVAVQFMLQQGRHFCDTNYCNCVDRLAEIIQWERHVGALAEREQVEAAQQKRKRPLAKTRVVPAALGLGGVDIRKASAR